MLLRRTGTQIVALTQPAHAWLAGRLADAWGGADFEIPAPRDGVVCAAALHDIGWLEWERAPALDQGTGFPLEFQHVPAEIHTKLWQRGVEQAATYGDLPALIVSRHGDAIYERTFDIATARPEAVQAVKQFRSAQAAFQTRIIHRLKGDATFASHVTETHLGFTKRFIVAVDTISLHLCWGLRDEVEIHDVPVSAQRTMTLTLNRASDGAIVVRPWPFRDPTFHASIEGKRLDRPCRDQADLDRLLAIAPPLSCAIDLRG